MAKKSENGGDVGNLIGMCEYNMLPIFANLDASKIEY